MKLARLFVASIVAAVVSWCSAAEKVEDGESIVFTPLNTEIVIINTIHLIYVGFLRKLQRDVTTDFALFLQTFRNI